MISPVVANLLTSNVSLALLAARTQMTYKDMMVHMKEAQPHHIQLLTEKVEEQESKINQLHSELQNSKELLMWIQQQVRRVAPHLPSHDEKFHQLMKDSRELTQLLDIYQSLNLYRNLSKLLSLLNASRLTSLSRWRTLTSTSVLMQSGTVNHSTLISGDTKYVFESMLMAMNGWRTLVCRYTIAWWKENTMINCHGHFVERLQLSFSVKIQHIERGTTSPFNMMIMFVIDLPGE